MSKRSISSHLIRGSQRLLDGRGGHGVRKPYNISGGVRNCLQTRPFNIQSTYFKIRSGHRETGGMIKPLQAKAMIQSVNSSAAYNCSAIMKMSGNLLSAHTLYAGTISVHRDGKAW